MGNGSPLGMKVRIYFGDREEKDVEREVPKLRVLECC